MTNHPYSQQSNRENLEFCREFYCNITRICLRLHIIISVFIGFIDLKIATDVSEDHASTN
jgi:hypothetical protein